MLELSGRIGNYQIDDRLRVGGMGVLYRGHRRGAAGFTRHVAIKVVHPHLASDPTFVRMLIDEALLAARIDHPNVVRVEELGDEQGVYFLAMEYVDGCSLAELMRALARRGRGLSLEMAAYIAIQIADGLHAAHETRDDEGRLLGVVHRDVSPHNVLLSFAGSVKLTDFGIAKARGRGGETGVGTLRGKLRYMSPEQIARGGSRVDRRSDVYALGIVLWELLTARRLFQADTDIELADIVRRPRGVTPPSTYAPLIGAAIDRLVLSALAADSAERPQTALDLRVRLAEAVPRALVIGPTELGALLAASGIRTRGRASAPPAPREPTGATSGTSTATPWGEPEQSTVTDPSDSDALTRFTIEARVEPPPEDDDRYDAPSNGAATPERGADRSPDRLRKAIVAGALALAATAAGVAFAASRAWNDDGAEPSPRSSSTAPVAAPPPHAVAATPVSAQPAWQPRQPHAVPEPQPGAIEIAATTRGDGIATDEIDAGPRARSHARARPHRDLAKRARRARHVARRAADDEVPIVENPGI